MTELQPLDVWEQGIQPLLPTAGLRALARALRTDSKALIEDGTCWPPAPTNFDVDPTCTGACPMAYPAWKADKLKTLTQVEDAFVLLCNHVNMALREQTDSERPVVLFVVWWDDPCIPRAEKCSLLLGKVEKELARRKTA